jgi:AraC-like DNA-binding protein/HAMP domain-containing protein
MRVFLNSCLLLAMSFSKGYNKIIGGGDVKRKFSFNKRLQGSGEKGNYFRKSLILVLLITSLPIAFISASNYYIGIDQIQKEVFKSHQIRFEQFSEAMNKQFNQIALVMSRWSTNPIFGDQLDHFEFIDHIDQTQAIMQSLLVVGGSNLLIGEAQLFLNRQKSLLTSEGIQHLNNKQLQPYLSLLRQKEGLFLVNGLPFSTKQKEGLPVSIIFKLPWYSQHPFGAFVLNLNNTEMEQMIRHIHSDTNGAAFLIQKTGEWVVQPDEQSAALSLQLRDLVLKQKDTSNSFNYKWKGESYLVSYGEVTKADWLYVTASPLSELMKPVIITSRLILTTSLCGIIAALLLAWFASNRLYKPIGRLVALFRSDKSIYSGTVRHEIEFIEQQWSRLTRESRTLQEQLQLSIPSLREGFLLQLVQGHLYSFNETYLKERMEQLGWEVRDKLFSIFLIQLSGFNEETARFKADDKQLITFAAANIAEELSQINHLHTQAINFQDLSVGLLCMFPSDSDQEQLKHDLYLLSQELLSTLGKVLGMNVTIIMCRQTDQASDIPELLEQARQVSRYRDLQENNQIINMDDFVPRPHSGAYYPFAMEKELLHVMRLGLEEESYRLFREFMSEIQRYTDRQMMVQQSLFQLLGNIRHILIEFGFTQHPLFTEGNLYEELIGISDPSTMEKWFKLKIMSPYLEGFQTAQNFRSRQLIEKVTDLLSTHYMKDISLEECAEKFSISPYTLSRSMKQITGINYVDYIMNLRINRAKDLLQTTHLKINEVAESIGYQHSYFNKIFKGSVGLTPTEYRQQHRKKV